ncbi:MAG: sensor histidine kinase [Clostridia bacterium]|nr:sensor histidine kinase [Clostridia bacterium]MBQ7048608.1 sensor histidine kinase [Clostridia bacterium]
MHELSLNILDVAQNSVSAGAKLIEISAIEDTKRALLVLSIKDNGCGMDEDTVRNVCDPFFTTRTTRKVGLGLPFLKQTAEQTGGSFLIESQVGKGTLVRAEYHTDSIDCMPLGDICSTISCLVTLNPDIDFKFTSVKDDKEFIFTTMEVREILGEDIALNEPAVAAFVEEYLKENSNH